MLTNCYQITLTDLKINGIHKYDNSRIKLHLKPLNVIIYDAMKSSWTVSCVKMLRF
jgi:hypothetical protein